MRHFASPLVLTASGSIGTLVQGSPLELASSVALLLDTQPGDRRSVPDYGLPDQLGDGLDPEEVYQAVQEWEPRADPTSLDLEPSTPATSQRLTVYPAAPTA